MRNNHFITILLSVSILLIGCSGSLIDHMSRINEDPGISEPRVFSFEEENTVRLEWDSDELADGYVLYKALDGPVLNFNEIYRGTSCDYIDREGAEGDLYHYSLAKVRGNKEFDKSDSVLGVISQTTCDSYEDNNNTEKATDLVQGILITANIFGFQDSHHSSLVDEDWYRVRVPAGCTANVIINQLFPLASDGAENHFKSYQEGQPAVPVIDGREINIVNGYKEPRDFYLKIFPNPTKFFPNPTAGGTIVSYRIHIDRVY